MHDYREIRVRLNLRRHRDRWLASALAEAAEAMGAPVASVVRRALATYLRDRGTARTTVASPPAIGVSTKHENREAHERGAASGGGIMQLPADSAAKESDATSHDETDPTGLMDRLALLGMPPEGATGGQ